MSLRMFLPVVLPACILFVSGDMVSSPVTKYTANTFDFSAERLSGNRVLLTWHTRGENSGVEFQVMRTFSRKIAFRIIGVGAPENAADSQISDYRFIDANNHSSDTSFYCLKKTRADGVVFYSIVLAVPGERR